MKLLLVIVAVLFPATSVAVPSLTARGKSITVTFDLAILLGSWGSCLP